MPQLSVRTGVSVSVMRLCPLGRAESPPVFAGLSSCLASASDSSISDSVSVRAASWLPPDLSLVVEPCAASAVAVDACACLTEGAVQPRSRAMSSPIRDAGPAEGPSSARSSGKPASTRSASRQVQTRGPRVERTSAPLRRSSTRAVAVSGVMLSMNSQLTVITGA